MSDISIVTQSSRGQIAIPANIRSRMNLQEGTRFAVYTTGDVIMLKKLEIPTENDFITVMKEAQSAAEEAGLKEEDISAAIKSVRSRKRASR